jgi:hypothetical protein
VYRDFHDKSRHARALAPRRALKKTGISELLAEVTK